MSEFTQSSSFGSLSIQLPSPTTEEPSYDAPSNDSTIYPMYQRGYTEGVEDGYGRGSENGYYQGYRDGKRDGYEEGYNEGIYRGMWFGTAWAVVASIMMFGIKSRH